jgi:hypothetical protein
MDGGFAIQGLEPFYRPGVKGGGTSERNMALHLFLTGQFFLLIFFATESLFAIHNPLRCLGRLVVEEAWLEIDIR